MNKKKLQYVSQKKVEKESADCQYFAMLGERSNGKSFCAKSLCIQWAIKNDRQFIYLRRYDLDTKDSSCEQYFADLPVQEITNGEYTLISVFRKGIYLANINEETGKVARGPKIGYCHSLGGAEHYKSLQFPAVDWILYEELLPKNGQYLYNEPDQLQHYVSTIFRQRKGLVFLIGNTLTRICPYYSKWGLEGTIRQPLGSIKEYIFHNENGDDTKLKVYLCDSLNYNSGMFFGSSAKNITQGAYETDEQAHLPKDVKNYKVLYEMVLQHDYLMFYMQLLQDSEKSDNIVWYVQPKTSQIKPGTRVVSTVFSTDPLYTRQLIGINQREQMIIDLIRRDKICFSDDLTGTEFWNVLPYFTGLRHK